jgi:phosphatidate cytidylyltransferase
MTSSQRAKAFNWSDLGLRAVSALVLIPAVVWAVLVGGPWFLLLVSLGVILLAMEWGVMTEPHAPKRTAVVVAAAVLAALFAASQFTGPGFLILVVGAALAAGAARLFKATAIDTAYGVFYIGWPCLVLIWLRAQLPQPQGRDWTILLFAIAWSSDIAAYALGNLVGGPKLWPRFSPNKTWSGFLGGLAAGVVGAVVATWLQHMPLSPWLAAAIGLVAGLATMAGDLWESALKRRFGVKDAGHLIPGHGGLMDRVDGLMFAVVALAAARLVVTFGGLS